MVNGAPIKADVYPLSENQQTKLLLSFLWTALYMASNVHITKNITKHVNFKSPRYWVHFQSSITSDDHFIELYE